jgi:hypothetical protein
LSTQPLNDIEKDCFRDFRDHGAQPLNDIENDCFRDSRNLGTRVLNNITRQTVKGDDGCVARKAITLPTVPVSPEKQ